MLSSPWLEYTEGVWTAHEHINDPYDADTHAWADDDCLNKHFDIPNSAKRIRFVFSHHTHFEALVLTLGYDGEVIVSNHRDASLDANVHQTEEFLAFWKENNYPKYLRIEYEE